MSGLERTNVDVEARRATVVVGDVAGVAPIAVVGTAGTVVDVVVGVTVERTGKRESSPDAPDEQPAAARRRTVTSGRVRRIMVLTVRPTRTR
jgi:hypothetical protein